MGLGCSSGERKGRKESRGMGDAASWYCGVLLLGLILLGSIKESSMADDQYHHHHDGDDGGVAVRGNQLLDRACDEIYVVGEGETLHTISDKCGDPFIVERNPHIHDPDDVFPGLVIKITPFTPPKSFR